MRVRLLVLMLCVVALATAAPAAFATRTTVIGFDHGPITLAYLDEGAPGKGVGDRRIGAIGLTPRDSDRRIGSVQAELVTTQAQRPSAGKEIRMGTLIFTVGNLAHQIVVEGVAVYNLTAPTIAVSTSTTRSITGGSGRYRGARGWCVSTHLKDGSWVHEFHLLRS
jgi:hypothetical protein